MSRKPQKKDAREQSTRQLMGIDDITDYGIATRMGELVFFAIKPTNISVLPDTGVGARIYALLNVVKGMAEIEMLALNSKESFENNKAFYRQRANEEELPVVRKLLSRKASIWIVFRCLWHPAGSSISSSGCRAKRNPMCSATSPASKKASRITASPSVVPPRRISKGCWESTLSRT